MFDLDPGKLLLIAVVAIFVLGPDKLPDAAHRVGSAWRSFNEFRHRMEAEVRRTVPDLPSTSELARLARSPAALLSHLGDVGADTVDLPEAHGDPTVPAVGEWTTLSPAFGDAAPASAAERGLAPSFAVAPGDANLN